MKRSVISHSLALMLGYATGLSVGDAGNIIEQKYSMDLTWRRELDLIVETFNQEYPDVSISTMDSLNAFALKLAHESVDVSPIPFSTAEKMLSSTRSLKAGDMHDPQFFFYFHLGKMCIGYKHADSFYVRNDRTSQYNVDALKGPRFGSSCASRNYWMHQGSSIPSVFTQGKGGWWSTAGYSRTSYSKIERGFIVNPDDGRRFPYGYDNQGYSNVYSLVAYHSSPLENSFRTFYDLFGQERVKGVTSRFLGVSYSREIDVDRARRINSKPLDKVTADDRWWWYHSAYTGAHSDMEQYWDFKGTLPKTKLAVHPQRLINAQLLIFADDVDAAGFASQSQIITTPAFVPGHMWTVVAYDSNRFVTTGPAKNRGGFRSAMYKNWNFTASLPRVEYMESQDRKGKLGVTGLEVQYTPFVTIFPLRRNVLYVHAYGRFADGSVTPLNTVFTNMYDKNLMRMCGYHNYQIEIPPFRELIVGNLSPVGGLQQMQDPDHSSGNFSHMDGVRLPIEALL